MTLPRLVPSLFVALAFVAGCSSEGDGGGDGGSGGGSYDDDDGVGADDGNEPEPNRVTCDQHEDPNSEYLSPGSLYCECTSDGGEGDTIYAGDACGNTGVEELCCADDGYPSSGGCGCERNKGYYCYSVGDYGCHCGFWDYTPSDGPPTTVCDNVPDAAGNPWNCCSYDSIEKCDCYEGPGGPDECSYTVVADCANPTNAGFTPFSGQCPAGRHQVTECSSGPTDPSTSATTGTASTSSGTPGCDSTACSGCVTSCDDFGCYSCCSGCNGDSCETTCNF